MLQLNGDKRELLWFSSATHLHRPGPSRSTTVSCRPSRVTVVRDLGGWIDPELSMRIGVSRVARTCLHLRRPSIRSVRRQLSRDVSARLVSAVVLSRLDYCNAVPAATLANCREYNYTSCSSETRTRRETMRSCNFESCTGFLSHNELTTNAVSL